MRAAIAARNLDAALQRLSCKTQKHSVNNSWHLRYNARTERTGFHTNECGSAQPRRAREPTLPSVCLKKRNVPRKSQHSNLNWSATYCSRTRSLDAAAPMHKAPQQLLTSIGQRQRQQRKSHLDTSVTVLAQMGQDSTLKRWRPTLLHNRTGRSVYLKNHNVWCKS